MGVLIALGLAAVTFWAIGSSRSGRSGSGSGSVALGDSRMSALSVRAANGDESAWPEIGRALAGASDAQLNALYDQAALAKTRAVVDDQRLYLDRLLEAIRAELNGRN